MKLTSIAHYVAGFLIPYIAIYIHWSISLIATILFILYELDEEFHLSDESYIDIKEFLIGLYIGCVSIIIKIMLYR